MKRKMIAGLLIFAMLFTFVPTVAFAAGASLSGGTLTISGTDSASGNGWSWDGSTLTLFSANTQDTINNIVISGIESVTIDVQRNVTLGTDTTIAVKFNTTNADAVLNITGNSNNTLTLTNGITIIDTANTSDPYKGTININSGNVTITSAGYYTPFIADKVNITGGNVTITAPTDGVYVTQAFMTISGGTVNITGNMGNTTPTFIGGNLTINNEARYIITYYPGEGTYNGGEQPYLRSCVEGKVALPDPTTNYFFKFIAPEDKPHFKGWAISSETTDIVDSPYELNEHTILYAVWTAGDDGSTDEAGIIIDDTYTDKTGYGWSYTKSGNTGTLEFIEDITLNDAGIKFTYTSSSVNNIVINVPANVTVTIDLTEGNSIEFLNDSSSHQVCNITFTGGGRIICETDNGIGIYTETDGQKLVLGSISVSGNTTISATGSSYGIQITGDLELENGSKIEAKGTGTSGTGIDVSEVTVNGGTLNAEGYVNGVRSSDSIVIASGEISAKGKTDTAIKLTAGNITVTGGTITAKSESTSFSAISIYKSAANPFAGECLRFTSPAGASYAKDTTDNYYYVYNNDGTKANNVVISVVHTEVTDAAVAATCIATGLTVGSHCSECNKVIVAPEVVAMTAHTYNDNNICTVCGDKKASTSTTTTSTGGGFSGSYNYPVSTTDVAGATVTFSDNNAVAGETVTITVTPDSGKQVDEVIVTDADGDVITVTKVGDNQYTFTMPAGKVSVAVTTTDIDYDNKIVLQIGNKNVVVDGKAFANDVAPQLLGDRTLVPIRVIVEALGGTADWNEATRTVTLTIDGKVLTLVIDEMIPGFGQGAIIMDSRTYVPIRYVAEYIGAYVEWIAATQQIVILK